MESAPSYRAQPFTRVGGALCIDFINTVSWRGIPEGERLTSYDELVYWGEQAGAVRRGEVKRLLAEAARRPAAAAAVLARALELREALARLVQARHGGSPADVAILNRALAAAPARTAIRARGAGYVWADEGEGEALAAPLHPVALSAADLLTSERLRRVRRCGDDRCAWIFLDTSRTGRRKWCSMDSCGNRAKVRRHYERTHPG